ncbi:Glucose/arabinose dehydrogenase, beta-propeller fold [Amycolatopsis marina]|uniref:Glucose/arabinose dehydrogenase, beta-propeller fold n=1 Tax=Amycolatopsis marina TaxID=490629 RepID=A0A1I1A4Z2_9PSEU|nr:PQQ-dependent sugar dehydrogenase [Amycolatopsis marina]SFB32987.1 Glucose/arabinose dehydrogenase, beta-propeller fold [Amycolatopsis marina]
MGAPTVRVRSRFRRLLAASSAVVLGVTGLAVVPAAPAAAVPAGFRDTVAIGGLSSPTAAAFAPDGRVFVAEKSGIVKVFDSLADPSATVFADLRKQTQDFWDRGLLGLAVDPEFPARPFVYVSYTYDAEPGGKAPRWGDACPTPPGATDKGCVVTGRVSKLTMGGGGTATKEQPLVTGWCQQYPSHTIGTVAFGPDGNLYVGGGDGASFNFADQGQVGNPCADPPGPRGSDLVAPNAEGGALRSQSPQRPAGQPVVLNGAILRIDPDTGAGVAGNPFASSADANARRIIAYGLRNQFRFTFRPGSNELWAGDVGWHDWEEINRVADVTDRVAENFGWPCYEGNDRQTGYSNLDRCQSLYSGAGQTAPYHAYSHGGAVANGDGCAAGGSSISGIAFESGDSYPSAYDGALFFADSSRGCIWAMRTSVMGDPSPSRITPFVTGASIPVQVLAGPGGDLFYVALGSGELRRVSYRDDGNRPPVARATAKPSSGPAPLTVRFDGGGSSDPDSGDTLTYAWDLDGDGAYDDAAGPKPTRTYSDTTVVEVGLRVTDSQGVSDTTKVSVTVGSPRGDGPVPEIDEPTGSLNWRVGQPVRFSGKAVDPRNDALLPASALSWRLAIRHCVADGSCHTHRLQDFNGVGSGTFTAPDHEYPSYLELTLMAKDSSGRTGTRTMELRPETTRLDFTSSPSGALLSVAGSQQRTPFSRTVIVGSNNSISAASPQRLGVFNTKHAFTSWSDGGQRTHNITAPAGPKEYRANYSRCSAENPC